MKFIFGLVVIFVSPVVLADAYTCSYPAYLGSRLVILKIKIDGTTAKVDGDNYSVLKNTKLGIVLVRSFAEYNQSTKDDDLGLFGITVNKKTLNFTRGNILDNEKGNSAATGSCVKDK